MLGEGLSEMLAEAMAADASLPEARQATDDPDRRGSRRALRVLGRMSLRTRRSVLWIVGRCAIRLRLLDIDAADVCRIAEALQLPAGEARRVARANAINLLLFALEGASLSVRSAAGLLRDGARIRCTNDEALEWVAEQPSAILAGLHTGAFPIALAWLLQRHFKGRDVVLLRAKRPDADEVRAFERLARFGVRARHVVLEDGDGMLDALRTLRRGGVLAMLVDMPPGDGRADAVEILWRPARIASGVAEISAMCSAPVMLFSTRSSPRGDVIEIDGITQADRHARGRSAIPARVASLLTRTLIARPEQWLFWRRLQEFQPMASA